MTVPEAVEPERREKKQGLLKTFGPGLITGASDDDPSGIATYSQVGASSATACCGQCSFPIR